LAACKYLIKPVVVPTLRFLATILAKIVYFFNQDDAIIQNLYDIINYMNKMSCNSGNHTCEFPSSSSFDAEFGSLPVATRCWANFDPDIDTSNAFSCTPSDTCRVSTLEFGESLNEFGSLGEDGNQIVCDSCPLQPGNLVNQFGCDAYTKQCTCNRWVFGALSRCHRAYIFHALHVYKKKYQKSLDVTERDHSKIWSV
jgi:hypothetical protein